MSNRRKRRKAGLRVCCALGLVFMAKQQCFKPEQLRKCEPNANKALLLLESK